MIQKVHAYKTTDDQTWPTMELAQERELRLLLAVKLEENEANAIIHDLVMNRDKVMDILTMKKSSRPKARKINRTAGSTRRIEPLQAGPAPVNL